VGETADLLESRRNFSVGLTGLALLAFLGSGYTHRPLPEALAETCPPSFLKRTVRRSAAVARAIDFLRSVQDSDGCFARSDGLDLRGEGYMYNHAICTLALVEACRLTGDESLVRPARRGVRFIESAQCPRRGGWDYCSSARPEGAKSRRCDVSVTSWQVMALWAARDAGWPFRRGALEAALRFLKRRTRRDGSLQYAVGTVDHDGERVSREHRIRRSLGVTAAGVFTKGVLGASPASADMEAGVSLLAENLPDAHRLAAGTGTPSRFHTAYYWYYGTLAAAQRGGEAWSVWWEILRPTLARTQNRGSARGSWAPRGEFLGAYVGRLYVTLFNLLSLEVSYRTLSFTGGGGAGGRTCAVGRD
jgi:hypothetical protein